MQINIYFEFDAQIFLIFAVFVRYMESLHHLIIMGVADYPCYDSNGRRAGMKTCAINDRIWCAYEMAIRDCLAVKVLGHQKSEVIILDEMAKEVVRGVHSGSSIAAKISESFRDENFFDRLQGLPADVAEIKAELVSEAFYGSRAAFNDFYRKRMVKLFAENIPQVPLDVPTASTFYYHSELAAHTLQFLQHSTDPMDMEQIRLENLQVTTVISTIHSTPLHMRRSCSQQSACPGGRGRRLYGPALRPLSPLGVGGAPQGAGR